LIKMQVCGKPMGGFVRLELATLLHCESAEKQKIAGRAKLNLYVSVCESIFHSKCMVLSALLNRYLFHCAPTL
jgi:hypothetical protein